ncbi:hypothetical protein SAMN04487996_107270 [Dyadobacter soli]|uniref:Uncharacterized protein n=1 Tax=Dyadobacter soli TaxID=659014 RepID=A0A1G7GIY4_9BACT|nr:hypothetical protein [Dyadobacter soli]SDE88055.1 hypothetical protein SAMN04487996_107270 [Dyadobacter soli]
MKQYFIFGALLLLGISGCKKDDGPSVDPQIEEARKLAALQDQFHGKYRLISAVADQNVDINMDGFASNNLLTEIPELQLENHPNIVELRIYGPNHIIANAGFLLSQGWPEQYIWNNNKEWDGGPDFEYKDGLSVSYANQGTVRQFTFTEDLKEITVQRNTNENPFRWVAPESVKINNAGLLHFVNKRYLYTKEGVKQVTIQSVYQRFTKET